jgi:hypothetical protein
MIRTSGGALYIAGGGDRGVLYGVYDLLERFGCRWFLRMSAVSRIPDALSCPARRGEKTRVRIP